MKGFVIFLLCLGYVISPIDLAPEAVLGPFGLADDLVALIVGIKALMDRSRP